MKSFPLYLSLIVGVISVSFAAIFIRLAQADAWVIAFYRMGFAALFLLPFGVYYRPAKVRKSQWFGLLLGGVFLALHFLFWISSFEYTSVANSVFIVTTQPIFVAVFGYLFLKERLHTFLIWGILSASLGSIIIGLGEFSVLGSSLGNFLALLGAIMAAGYLLVGRSLRQSLPLSFYAATVYGISALILLVYNLVVKAPLVGYTPSTWLYFLLLAIVPTVIGHTCFNWALKYVPAPLVAISILGEPVGATILAYLLLSEPPSLPTMIGGAFIMLGIFLSSRHPKT